ncbi:hypothetical protein MLD52_03045 [Puniceicoccaceae bacterium K14]|nr:hypothetical protein [Puniceicoccaceae bacterium K14]
MIDFGNTESIDGYKIRWVSSENVHDIKKNLELESFEGIGLNPYRGEILNLLDIIASSVSFRALALPFANKVGITSDYIERQGGVEMLWLSDFDGPIRLDHDSLRSLRVKFTKNIEIGKLPSLRSLFLFEAPKVDLCSLAERASGVQNLEITNSRIDSIDGIDNFEDLQMLDLTYLKNLRSLAPLARCPKLEILRLESIKKTKDLTETLGKIGTLKELHLFDCGTLESLDFARSIGLKKFRCVKTRFKRKDEAILSEIGDVEIK